MISPEDKKALEELHKAFEGVELPEVEGAESPETEAVELPEIVGAEIPPEIKIRELEKGESASTMAVQEAASGAESTVQDTQTRLLESVLEGLTVANSHLEIISRVIGGP